MARQPWFEIKYFTSSMVFKKGRYGKQVTCNSVHQFNFIKTKKVPFSKKGFIQSGPTQVVFEDEVGYLRSFYIRYSSFVEISLCTVVYEINT